jgi:DNA helicase HerA-like ATPase
MGDLNRLLEDAIGKPDNRSNLTPFLRIKSRLTSLQSDRRFAFMFPPGVYVSDNLTQILGRILRVPVEGRPLAILDLAGMPSEVLNVVVSVLARIAFDFAFWSDQEMPILLVCEEAHRYAPQEAGLGFEPAKRALGRIAKEGRKYGASLCLVSQRPSELAQSLLSQCSTVFAMRMSSQRDQNIIQAALSEASSTLTNALPLLGTAEAIVVGEGVPVPMRIRFDELPPNERPRSNSAPFSAHWQDDSKSRGILDRVVGTWRYRRYQARSVKKPEI